MTHCWYFLIKSLFILNIYLFSPGESFEAWDPHDASSEHCAKLYVVIGKWLQTKCDTEIGYICEYPGKPGACLFSTQKIINDMFSHNEHENTLLLYILLKQFNNVTFSRKKHSQGENNDWPLALMNWRQPYGHIGILL